MKSEMKVLEAGFYSSIQDLGRENYRYGGVPHAGAMDQQAMRQANALLGNREGDAVLEMTLKGGRFLFSHPTWISVVGAKTVVRLNKQVIDTLQPIQISEADLLEIDNLKNGNFIYLAIAGGFQTAEVLGSRSFYLGITDDAQLTDGQSLQYRGNTPHEIHPTTQYREPHQGQSLTCYAGPEFQLLDRKLQIKLLGQGFKLGRSWNRMAFQLQEKLHNELEAIPSGPVLPGTVQLTPDGQLIILMRDAQTTGGYPRVLQLTDKAIDQLSQTTQGQTIQFVIQSI
ncbi:5-oxoprolinase subunit C family protein [Nonlabens xiamenensis]|uniref:5-oxoprolinase subunit C family protein n=1 Tax=Nonlabens xiamenensis TaxID=2341043 RepID=UPI000F60AB12|nr:biotin-dependent carboxyltransferase family protein [Nonlabens xiamenensis]